MTGKEDRDSPTLDPAFGLARRLGFDGIRFKHANGVEFVRQTPESASRGRELATRDGTGQQQCRASVSSADPLS